MINHRGVEFQDVLERITAGLKQLFQTEHDVLVLTTSGTGAMESVVVNTLSQGDRALVISIGSFGDRFAEIAQTYGAEIDKVDFEWGAAAEPAAVAAALEKDRSYKAIFITHNETSTGVTNPLEAIAKAVRGVRPDILILVDAISSLGSLPCAVDAWDLDVVATGSQKGWMVPPGLAMVSVSPRAWQAWEQATMPRYYFDFGKAKDFLTKGQTPWTPAVSIFFALDVALEELTSEGIEGIVTRHRRYGEYTRREVTSMGLRILPEERYASNTVTAAWLPDGVTWKALDELLRTEYQVELQGGQGKLAGKIFRIGHLGWVVEDDLHAALGALRAALPKLGYKLPEATPAG
jgi:aspartate aminotransferase-like enzyme